MNESIAIDTCCQNMSCRYLDYYPPMIDRDFMPLIIHLVPIIDRDLNLGTLLSTSISRVRGRTVVGM